MYDCSIIWTLDSYPAYFTQCSLLCKAGWKGIYVLFWMFNADLIPITFICHNHCEVAFAGILTTQLIIWILKAYHLQISTCKCCWARYIIWPRTSQTGIYVLHLPAPNKIFFIFLNYFALPGHKYFHLYLWAVSKPFVKRLTPYKFLDILQET